MKQIKKIEFFNRDLSINKIFGCYNASHQIESKTADSGTVEQQISAIFLFVQ